MKTIHSDDIFNKKEWIYSDIVHCNCPYCNKEIFGNRIVPTVNKAFGTKLGNRCAFESESYHLKEFISGDMILCPECKELFFVYTTSDTRICRQCIHVDVNNPDGSLHYKCKLTGMPVGWHEDGNQIHCDKFLDK